MTGKKNNLIDRDIHDRIADEDKLVLPPKKRTGPRSLTANHYWYRDRGNRVIWYSVPTFQLVNAIYYDISSIMACTIARSGCSFCSHCFVLAFCCGRSSSGWFSKRKTIC